jgi:PIN domain nuclease of toxin-antitoxin system
VRLLLDTCTFLWLIGQRAALSEKVRDAIADPANDCFLSAASLWEILIKHGGGRLEIDSRGASPEGFLIEQREAHGLDPLPIDEESVAQLPKLPDLHRDPFDRMLVCQAIANGLTLVTSDTTIRRYPVRSLW